MTITENSNERRHKTTMNQTVISNIRPIKVRRMKNLKISNNDEDWHLPSITPSNNNLDESNLTAKMRVRNRHGYTTVDSQRDKIAKSTAPKRDKLIGN